MFQTAVRLFCIFLFPHHLGSVQIWDPLDLGVVCTGLALMTGFSLLPCLPLLLLWQLQLLLVLWPVPCSVQLQFILLFTEAALCESASFLFSSLPYVRLFIFYFWHLVMLLTLKNDNTTGSFWLCHLFYVLSMIYVYLWYVHMFWP